MVSIKDIAKDCNVSTATVSKALNNHTDVNIETKRRVRESAERLGYFPNSQARALKTKKTFNVGVIYEDKANFGLTHQFFSSVLNSFKTEIERLGYDVTFISSNVGDMAMSYTEHCRYRNVDGCAVVCADFHSDNIQNLIKADIPLVAVDYDNEGVCAVLSDNSQGIAELVRYIAAAGHKKIAYIYGDPSQVTDIRLKTFKDTMNSLGLSVNDNYVLPAKYHEPELTEKAVLTLLKLEDKPTCIIVPDDFASLGVHNAVKTLGLKIPTDISIAGYDGIKFTTVVHPFLTTFQQDTVSIGKKLAGLLFRQISISHDADSSLINASERIIVVKGRLIEGETVAKIS